MKVADQRDSDPGTPRRSRLGSRGYLIAILAVAVFHVAGRVGSFCSPIHADSYVYGSIGYRLAHGDVFYRDVSDVKPPGLYLLYAAAFRVMPRGRWAMIPVDTLFGLLGYWAVYLLGRELYGMRVGLIVMVIAAAAMNFFMVMDFATDGFGLSEGFMVLPAALAVRCYLLGIRRRDWVQYFLCGLWVGVEFLIKQTVLPLMLAIGVHWLIVSLVRHRDGWIGKRLLHGGMMVVGGLVAIAPCVVLVMVQGTWRRALEVLGPDAARMLNLETAWPSQWSNILPVWVPLAWSVVGVIGWVEMSLRCRSTPNMNRLSAHDLSFLMLWTVAEAVMLVYLPLRAYHYYVLSFLPLLLLSGCMWSWLEQSCSELHRDVARACIATAAVVSLSFALPIVKTMWPVAVARWRTYDAEADRSYFDKIVSLGQHDFGAPPPAQDEAGR